LTFLYIGIRIRKKKKKRERGIGSASALLHCIKCFYILYVRREKRGKEKREIEGRGDATSNPPTWFEYATERKIHFYYEANICSWVVKGGGKGREKGRREGKGGGVTIVPLSLQCHSSRKHQGIS
jgi:hypothetical protein